MAELDKWIEIAKDCKYLPEYDLKKLCDIVCDILLEESNIQPVSTPVTVCGDIHGQPMQEMRFPHREIDKELLLEKSLEKTMELRMKISKRHKQIQEIYVLVTFVREFYDLEELFRCGGQVPDTNYVFMGDFVDRGYYSLETLTRLLTLKARYPDKITLLRGNHESRQITKVYGFYDECLNKYGNVNAWKYCCRVFDLLTIAALIDEDILCVHGGLSPEIKTLDQIRTIDRNGEIPYKGAFCDLVWSDPEDLEFWAESPRGAGWLFGSRVTDDFMTINNLQLICRAHQLVNEGIKYMFNDKLVTVWSAPNYCYRCGNVASILSFSSSKERNYRLFKAVPDAQRVIPAQNTTPYFL